MEYGLWGDPGIIKFPKLMFGGKFCAFSSRVLTCLSHVERGLNIGWRLILKMQGFRFGM